jgi:hypothetical protein
MKLNNTESWTVNQVATRIAGAREVLRNNHIDANMRRFSLDNAAAATSNTSDQLLAVANYRMRRAARRAETVDVAAEEGELVA